MKPINEKSLFHFLCDVMEGLYSGTLEVEKGIAICKTANEISKLISGERDRARLMMEINSYNKERGQSMVLRELASKGFENTTITHYGSLNLDANEPK